MKVTRSLYVAGIIGYFLGLGSIINGTRLVIHGFKEIPSLTSNVEFVNLHKVKRYEELSNSILYHPLLQDNISLQYKHYLDSKIDSIITLPDYQKYQKEVNAMLLNDWGFGGLYYLGGFGIMCLGYTGIRGYGDKKSEDKKNWIDRL